MLQLFHPSVAKVNLNVGWSSQEERELAREPWRHRLVSWRNAPPEDVQGHVRAVLHCSGVGPHRAASESTSCSPMLSPGSWTTSGADWHGRGSLGGRGRRWTPRPKQRWARALRWVQALEPRLDVAVLSGRPGASFVLNYLLLCFL
jgi:hypothetical protein